MTVGLFMLAARLFQSFGTVVQPETSHPDIRERMFPRPYIHGLGAVEEQGRRPEMEDVKVAIANVESLQDCWILAVYDGHGGRQTAEALSRRLHGNFLKCLRSRTLARWQEFRHRAIFRAQELRDFLERLNAESTQCATLSPTMIADFMGTLRLQQILEWIIRHPTPRLTGEGPRDATAFDIGLPPHYLTVCSVADIEKSAQEAFAETDYEILQRERITESGATACFCFVNPLLDIERILAMPPREVTQEDCDLFTITDSHNNKNSKQSSLFVRNLTVAHVGDTRALLVFTNGEALRLTNIGDHKASDIREVERIERLGGKVCDDRVNGLLAIGRAFGDWNLKLSHQELVESQVYSTSSRGVRVVRPAADTWREQQRDYVVSHVPHVRSANLSALLSGEDRGKFGWGAGLGTKTCGATRIPLALVLGCDGLFDVCTDRDVGQICAESLQWISEHHPGTTPEHAGTAVARVLVNEAILQRGSTDNVSVQVALLNSLEVLQGPTPPRCPETPPPPPLPSICPRPPPVAARQCYQQRLPGTTHASFEPRGDGWGRSGERCGWGRAGCGSKEERWVWMGGRTCRKYPGGIPGCFCKLGLTGSGFDTVAAPSLRHSRHASRGIIPGGWLFYSSHAKT